MESDDMKMEQNRKIQIFFKDKVYTGIGNEKLVRKVYRGKRDEQGHRKNEIFYVNSRQDFRISESMLVNYVKMIMDEIEYVDTDLIVQSTDSKKQLFLINQKDFLNHKHNLDEYKAFISDMLTNDDNQIYLNDYIRRSKKNDDSGWFKNIIEKIEVYETGLVCILNNGFELSVQF